MKRMLGKLRRKPKKSDQDQDETPQQAIPRDLSRLNRGELEDLLSRMTISATITSHEAIPGGTSRPAGVPSANAGGALGAIYSAFSGESSTGDQRNRSSEVCSVCLDLDPTVDPAQMSFESNLWLEGMQGMHPLRTVSATRQELEKSSATCAACFLLCSGINWGRPEFFDSDEIVQIHLTGGLPLRLTIHKPIDQRVISEERALQDLARRLFMGVQEYDYSDRMSLPVEELEFYYSIPLGLSTLAKNDPRHPENRKYKFLGYACKRLDDSSQDEVFRGINFVLQDCQQNHPKCKQALQNQSPLPDRVLDIGSAASPSIHLVNGGGRKERYIALSYCWGTGANFTTTTATLASRQAGIPVASLPLLLQDVVTVARRLSIRFVWIDALCILQDSRPDWEVQSAKMGSVYAGAHLTLAAANAASVHERLLGPRDNKWTGAGFTIPGTGGEIGCRRPTLPLRSTGEIGPISTRGWTLQERLLSTRVLTYTEAAFRLECMTQARMECQFRAAGPTQLGPPRESNHRVDWETLVHWYTGRRLTVATDRLPAISALARQMRGSAGWTYAAGLWLETLPQGLCWRVVGERPAGMQPDYVAPSWSWASVDGQVRYSGSFNAELTTQTITWEAQAEHGEVFVEGENDLGTVGPGTYLEVVGQLVPCIIDVPPWRSEQDDGSLVCQIRPVGSSSGKAIELRPDLPLFSPGDMKMQDASRPGVSRWTVLVDEAVVKERTAVGIRGGGVYALRLGTITDGHGSARCMAMILGNSLIETNSWERLGLVDDVPLEFFEGATRELLKVL